MERPCTFQPPHRGVEQRRWGHFPCLARVGHGGRYASHGASAAGWAESQGFTNLRVTDTVSLLAALDDLLDEAATAPVLLEVFTDAETDAEEQRNYYHAIKEEWKNFLR